MMRNDCDNSRVLPLPEVSCKSRHSCPTKDEARLRAWTAEAKRSDTTMPLDAALHWETRAPEVPEPCPFCQGARRRREALRSSRLLPFYVVASGTVRCYGGPEEGGWWYDKRRIIEVRAVFTVTGALHTVRELRLDHPTCPKGRHSVIGGEDVEIGVFYDETMFPQESSGGRPSYE